MMIKYLKCKGLLIKRKDQMTLYTLNVNVASVCSTSVSVIYQDLCLGVNFTLGHVCSAVKKLVL